MKRGEAVMYLGDSFNLNNKIGLILKKTRYIDREMWVVDFGKNIGEKNCLEINLIVVDHQLTFIWSNI